MEDNVENEYIVTDENGCATDPLIFGEWEHHSDSQSLMANFNAFKFPSSDNIRFQCNIRVCFGKCQPVSNDVLLHATSLESQMYLSQVNCRGYNAFGRRRRDVNSVNNTALSLTGDGYEGQLREEVTIFSNLILTTERREERYTADPAGGKATFENMTGVVMRRGEAKVATFVAAPSAQRVEDICVSMISFIVALVITALLALVAVAIAVSCWLMAYRRQPKTVGPLPHPPEFPNPLFTTESVAEPSPDYHLS